MPLPTVFRKNGKRETAARRLGAWSASCSNPPSFRNDSFVAERFGLSKEVASRKKAAPLEVAENGIRAGLHGQANRSVSHAESRACLPNSPRRCPLGALSEAAAGPAYLSKNETSCPKLGIGRRNPPGFAYPSGPRAEAPRGLLPGIGRQTDARGGEVQTWVPSLLCRGLFGRPVAHHCCA